MTLARPPFINGEIYHVVARGIEGREIFQDDADYYRAIHDLFEFNDEAPAQWQFRQHYDIRSRSESRSELSKKPRRLLVDLLSFCLMPNHIHLLLRQRKDKGLSLFMRKFGVGYARYFNARQERKGYLFQGRFKAIPIKTDEQLKTVFVYIHTNPVALVERQWKEGNLKNAKKAIDFIESYRWSSYADYIGQKNFPSVTQRDFLNAMMNQKSWREFVNDWITHKTNQPFGTVVLE